MRLSSTARFKATRHQRSLGALTAPAFSHRVVSRTRQVQRCFHSRAGFRKLSMPALTEDTVLIRRTIASLIERYRELTAENDPPPVSGRRTGWSNSSLPTPSCASSRTMGRAADPDEATTQPLRRLPCDAIYQRARAYLRAGDGRAGLHATRTGTRRSPLTRASWVSSRTFALAAKHRTSR